jgi:hypothetical protein
LYNKEGQVFERRFILGGRKQQEASEKYIEKEFMKKNPTRYNNVAKLYYSLFI